MALRGVVCALVILATIFGVTAAAASGRGSVYVTTLPPGATVWLDGGYMGETPLFIDGLDSGRHFITLTRAGWQPQSTAADVIVGHVTSVSAVLAPNTSSGRLPQSKVKGMLSVRGAAGAKVYLDGVPIALPRDAQPVSAGDHILMVQRGSERSTSVVRIYPEITTTVSLTPRSSAASTGTDEDVLVALENYVPRSDFLVAGDIITIHHRGIELECAIGSRNYVFNGKPGTLTIAPAIVGNKPYLPLSLLNRLTTPEKSAAH